MSSDEEGPGECSWCGDNRGFCDGPHLDEGRRFSIKLEEAFDCDMLIPCHGRPYVLERMGFEDHERNETKKINLRTHHGMDFEVNLYNSKSVSHFGCPGGEALCNMYDFQEGMFVTMVLGDPDIDQDNLDIWVLVDTLPILRLSYFHSSKNVRNMVDRTNYTDGFELTYQEKSHLVAYCTDLENYNAFYRTPPNYGQYVPLVHLLNHDNFHGDILRIPMDCVPHLMYQNGRLDVLNIQPGHPTNLTCPYRISKTGEHMVILEWKKCMDSCKEVLGSNIVRKARIGDRVISILHNGESGAILFYAILPKRI
ncbi:hypothetical protein VPH35_033575 [Triticum aestivum]